MTVVDLFLMAQDKLKLTEKTIKIAEMLFLNYGPIERSTQYVSVIAGCIYIASILNCKDRRTQMDIAYVMGITEPTLRKHCQKINNKLNLNIDTNVGKKHLKSMFLYGPATAIGIVGGSSPRAA